MYCTVGALRLRRWKDEGKGTLASKFEYDEKESKRTERGNLAPEVVRPRMHTVDVLGPRVGEWIIDVGCGPGLLVHDLAVQVGPEGRVVGLDSSLPMLQLAEHRCAELPQVEFLEGDATSLAADDATFDAVACMQVLLYIADIDKVLEELYRVLKPGGRVAITETDWRGAVINSTDSALTEKMVAAWDHKVANPNLPVRLGPLLRRHGFCAVRVEAIPILSTSYVADGWSVGMLDQTDGTTTANWRVIGGTGDYAMLHGNGKLVGTPIVLGASILDLYTGQLH